MTDNQASSDFDFNPKSRGFYNRPRRRAPISGAIIVACMFVALILCLCLLIAVVAKSRQYMPTKSAARQAPAVQPIRV